jgi:hypothetical protein
VFPAHGWVIAVLNPDVPQTVAGHAAGNAQGQAAVEHAMVAAPVHGVTVRARVPVKPHAVTEQPPYVQAGMGAPHSVFTHPTVTASMLHGKDKAMHTAVKY